MDLVKQHATKLLKFYKVARENPASGLAMSYDYMRQIASYYYDGNKMSDDYKKLADFIYIIENDFLSQKYIIDFHHSFNTKQKPDCNNVLDYIVWCGRKAIMPRASKSKEVCQDLANWQYGDLCFEASKNIWAACNKLGVRCYVVKIVPGFDDNTEISHQYKHHFFVVVQYDSRQFIVDITYAQFFEERFNQLDRLGIPLIDVPEIGCYMKMLPNGSEIAYKLFTDGYFEITEKSLKTYFDSFTLSYRNALYYEEGGILLPYSIEQYMNFINDRDSQFKHEKIYCLGRQSRPLKNPNISPMDLLMKNANI